MISVDRIEREPVRPKIPENVVRGKASSGVPTHGEIRAREVLVEARSTLARLVEEEPLTPSRYVLKKEADIEEAKRSLDHLDILARRIRAGGANADQVVEIGVLTARLRNALQAARERSAYETPAADLKHLVYGRGVTIP